MHDTSALPAGYTDIHPGAGVGFSGKLGPLFINEDTQRIAFQVAEDHVNPAGMCHGGALAVFADTQLAAVARLAGLSDKHTPTISLAIDYLSPAPIGALVEMHVTLVQRTKAMVFTQGLMVVGEQTIARTNAIYRHYDG